MPPVDILHFCLGYQSLGGVESILHQHYDDDLRFGLRSRFAVYFEDGPADDERIRYLAFNERSTIRRARSKVRQAVTRPSDLAVYHATWGMAYLADLDQAGRRVLLLHGYFPGIEMSVLSRGPWVDGILCVSEPLQATIRHCLPQMDPARIGYIPYPIRPPPELEDHPPFCSRPLLIGFSGRLLKEQKRVDRFPELCRQLDRQQVNYRMEFLGDGPDRAWLESQLGGDSRLVFHGRRAGAEYWRTMSRWDVIVFLSDYEGTPISMIEAMSRGVVPVYPAIQTGGDAYAQATAPQLLYKAGDIDAAVHALGWLAGRSAEEFSALRERARTQVARHHPDSYHRVFDLFVRQILATPRIGHSRLPFRPFPIDLLSFRAIEKLADLKRKFSH